MIIKLANATTLDQSAVHSVTNETAPMNKNALPASMAPDKGKPTVTHSPITEHDQIRGGGGGGAIDGINRSGQAVYRNWLVFLLRPLNEAG